MKEKEVWTLDGRKKILLVNDRNQVIREIDDLGPLNETEKLWVLLCPGIPYEEWLKEYQKDNSEADEKKDKKKGKKVKMNK
jgi:hypothetical protein